MDAKTEELTGAEALARLRDDDGTIIPPGDFIELSNSIGVDHLQRYYYSKPLSIPDFLQKYSK